MPQSPPYLPWFVTSKPISQPSCRLFCFPFAGGDALVFREWQHYLGDNIEVLALQAPGRRERLAETPITDIEQMVNLLIEHISPLLDVPCYFYGHSNGALIAFSLALALQKRQITNIQHIFLAARKSPLSEKRSTPYHLYTDDDFINKVAKIGGLPSSLLADQETKQLLLPSLRADFQLGETYQCLPNESLLTDATLFYGTRDQLATLTQMQQWQTLLSKNISYKAIPGKHFFLFEQLDLLLREIKKIIQTKNSK